MPLDYQQILLEMNRPRRRQGGSIVKLAVWLFLFLAVVGAGYAVWHFGYVDHAREKAAGLWTAYAPSWLPGSGNETESAPATAIEDADPEQMVLAGAGGAPAAGRSEPLSLSVPPAQPSQPIPAPNGALSIEAESRPALRNPAMAEASAQIATLTPEAKPATASVPVKPAAPAPVPAPAKPAVVAPPPVLSDAKAQLKYVDQLLRSDPAEAMKRLEQLTASVKLQPEDAADAGYRVGYAARLLKDEDKAEKSWLETLEKYPAARGGRYSALALADTWYRRYASERPQVARWDDIQLLYSRVIGEDDAPFLPPDVKAAVKANLNRLNDSVIFGSAPTKMARYHRVENGELLGGIAGQYRVDYESLARINGVNPNRIRAGMDLKVVVGEVSIVVRKNSRDPNSSPTLTWFLDGRWVREYPTCVGDGNKTPAGTYQLVSKERDPSWTNPANGQLLPNDHPENILGSRWMAMKGMNTQGLGIHGTTVDDSIPGYTSAGCVRLHNQDVEELFSLARIGAKVTIVE